MQLANPNPSVSRKQYVALSGILSKNHDEKVKDYLAKMDGLSIDEIIHGKPPATLKRDEEGTLKQLQTVNAARNKANLLVSKNQCKLRDGKLLFSGFDCQQR